MRHILFKSKNFGYMKNELSLTIQIKRVKKYDSSTCETWYEYDVELGEGKIGNFTTIHGHNFYDLSIDISKIIAHEIKRKFGITVLEKS